MLNKLLEELKEYIILAKWNVKYSTQKYHNNSYGVLY